MKTFLVFVFCLLVVDHGDVAVFGQQIGLDWRVESLDMLPTIDNWIVIMQRLDGSINFNRNWTEYRNGFGEIGRGEFWLGNEIVHRLTNRLGDVYTLRIEMFADGAWYYADYTTFSLDSEDNKYALHLSGFSGNAGDSLTNTSVWSGYYHGGMSFSAPDFDNDKTSEVNCAQHFQAGWWFNDCWYCCLTCPYGADFSWYSLNHMESDGNVEAARMKIKRYFLLIN